MITYNFINYNFTDGSSQLGIVDTVINNIDKNLSGTTQSVQINLASQHIQQNAQHVSLPGEKTLSIFDLESFAPASPAPKTILLEPFIMTPLPSLFLSP